MPNVFDQFDQSQGSILTDPKVAGQMQGQALTNQRTAATLPYEAPQAGATLTRTQQAVQDRPFERGDKLRSDFDARQQVKDYRTSVPLLISALKTKRDPQGDNALIYAYAKIMDPNSVVRESEAETAANTAGYIDAQVERLKKNLGFDGAVGLPREVSSNLLREMNTKVAQFAKAYGGVRRDFQDLAQRQNVNPADVVGRSPAEGFGDQYKQLTQQQGWTNKDEPAAVGEGATIAQQTSGNPLTGEQQRIYDAFLASNPNASADDLRGFVKAAGLPELANADEIVAARKNGFTSAQQAQYNETPLSQGLSGINEGIASTLGAPVDLANAALGLGAQGINAVAGTDLAVSDNPFLGSDWFRQQMSGLGTIGDESNNPNNQFIRRVGQSVGASAIPTGATARTGRALMGMFGSAVGGGTGAAIAQRVSPGNVGAEMAGELIGGGIPAAGSLWNVRNRAQQAIDDAVPTIPQLKEQAGNLYRQAEQNGVAASPMQTQQLSDDLSAYLRQNGLISPAGRLTETMPAVKEGFGLVDDYAKTGSAMTPTQMEPVRRRLAEGMMSQNANERRVAGDLVDHFDAFSQPLAPEFGQARDVASRYLTAEQIAKARELADARASQFTGSGLENALRTEFRGLDRGAIKGSNRFSDDVTAAIENVSRGTPTSNFARGLGRMAPTGPVSFGLGTVAPASLGGMVAGPVGAAVAGTTAGGLGMFGRRAATAMTGRNAQLAELVARNGGNLPKPQVLTPDIERLIGAGLFGQASQYLQ